MKVAHFIDSGGLYGAEKMLLTLCKEQIKLGLEPLIVSCGVIDEPPKALEIACEKEGVPCLPWRMKPGLNLSGCKNLLKHLEPMKFDVFHSHGYKFNILLALLTIRPTNYQLVATIHGETKSSGPNKITLFQFADRMLRFRFDKIVHVTTQNRASKARRVIFNGINIPKNNNSPAPTNPTKVITIGTLGRLSQEKNYSFLIDAMHHLKSKNLKIKCKIHGEGSLQSSLQEQIEKLQITDTVSILPFTKNIAEFFDSIDIYINCSTTEGMPISLLEAAAFNKRVIASNINGNKTLLNKLYSNPILFDFSHDAFEYAIESALKAPISEIIAARENISELFSGSSMAKQYYLLYKEA
ncbi:glycosyltransferase [Simiduia aestuariiviva]|uniref:Glycosyltransferase involved in cell wall biosynthesis n=1 Tax=Simiduia aestuariiviva TaxID=1510459 RepID=A0A839UXA7_9GAMM|nr:glycosyltransferase [Simiduia aestuariiviva]MBB3170088.1 glycosyltransferase involved in cell wall biosynthesis [Simiduia aestuariiviva]